MKKILCIFTSDWHWWHNAPVFRSNENSWFEAQGRNLKQIDKFKNNSDQAFPIIFAGDLFDHYNPPPEAINAILRNIPSGLVGIPGQHDLCNHVLENIEKTGIYTLAKAEAIYLPESFGTAVKELDIWCNYYFCPWGFDFQDIKVEDNGRFNVLVAHKYVWFDDSTRYGGNDIPSGKLSGLKSVLQKFDYAVFGDNHIPFRCKVGKCQVINCGTLNRRKLDEKDYETGFTVLYEDGTIEFIPFDTSKDKFLSVTCKDCEETSGVSTSEFFKELDKLDDCDIDFQEQVERKAEETGDKQMTKTFAQIFNNYGA